MLGIEALRVLAAEGPHFVAVTGGFRHFTKKGRATVTQEDARLTLTPVHAGIRYGLSLESLFPWFEAAFIFCPYKENSNIKTSRGTSTGYHIQAGLSFRPSLLKGFFFTLFVRHAKLTAEENGIRVDLGGFEYGTGLGFCFNLF